MFFQFLLVSAIVLGAVIYAVRRLRRSVRQDSPCCGCEGCELCKEWQQNARSTKKQCCEKKKDCQKFAQSK
ncbi:MAG: FeoB-associated Cys-rich membrane protein [Bacteroidales bacterium]|nr:FeoB-associated Cys-rich membrane protein [Bacteroidales bacterium]